MKLFSLTLLSACSLQAAVLTQTETTDLAIPDGVATGTQDQLSFNSVGQTITSVLVNLQIVSATVADAFLGDLYIYLTDGIDLVTLTNRAGQSATLVGGYDDSVSMNVTFNDSALNGDFHAYRSAFTAPEFNPDGTLMNTLTGSFQPDGRLTDPANVDTTDARASSLSVYNGKTAQRTFTLFAADFSSGSEHIIDSWGVTLNTVPEPSASLLAFLGGVCVFRRKR